MTMEHMDAIGIGWDVRGWQGSAQAVAVVGWQAREQRLHWFGVSPLFRLSSRVAPDLDALLRPALHDEIHLLQVLACPQLALGIDAPLAFPRALVELLAGRTTECAVPQREIDNPYAYRDCERWLHRQYGRSRSRPPSTGSATTRPWRSPCCPDWPTCSWCPSSNRRPIAPCWRSIPPLPRWGQGIGGARRAAGASASRCDGGDRSLRRRHLRPDGAAICRQGECLPVTGTGGAARRDGFGRGFYHFTRP